jgi:hypothetical protein
MTTTEQVEMLNLITSLQRIVAELVDVTRVLGVRLIKAEAALGCLDAPGY